MTAGGAANAVTSSSRLRVADLFGSPGDMGRRHGAMFDAEIRHYAADRIALVASGLWSGGPIDESEVLAIAESMLDAHAAYDPALFDELEAMAGAAGISTATAVVVGGFTDFVDTVRAVVGGDHPPTVVEDDCTMAIVPGSRSPEGPLFGQTWDMHDSATEHVVLLRTVPTDGPSARIFTTTGCLGQIGMNAAGVCVGINNLVGLDGQRGVTWPTVVRAMLTADDAAGALERLLAADLAGAHNFAILDAAGVGFNVEAMSTVQVVTDLEGEVLVHTNHTVHDATTALQAPKDPAMMASSTARLETAGRLTAEGDTTVESLMELTREPEAICQRATDPFHIESSGAAVMRPATGDFWACWGRPEDHPYEAVAAPDPTIALPDDVVAVGPRSGLEYTRLTRPMAKSLMELELETFPTAHPDDLYDQEEIESVADDFQVGTFVGFVPGDRTTPVAVGLGVRVDFDFAHPQHKIKELLDGPTPSGHQPEGRWYYGTDIIVAPSKRRRGIGRELYDLRKRATRRLGLDGIVAGGVIPGYADHKASMTPDAYIDAVRAKELYDPTLSFQLNNDFHALCALHGYIADPAVDDAASLIVWENPDLDRTGATDAIAALRERLAQESG